jgi:hypothetical protein
MKKLTFILMFAAALSLSAASIDVYQKTATGAILTQPGTASGFVPLTDPAKLSLPEGDLEVSAISNKLLAGVETVVTVTNDGTERSLIGIAVDGRFQWSDGTEPVVFRGQVEQELTVIVVHEEGDQVTRYIVDKGEGSGSMKSGDEKAAVSSGPVALHFLVRRPNSSQICEVVPGSNLGGRFVSIPARSVLGYYITCRTDRVSRGEVIISLLFGSGPATAGIRTPIGTFGGAVILPTSQINFVSTDPSFDNLVAFVRQGRWEASLRVPIGRRP